MEALVTTELIQNVVAEATAEVVGEQGGTGKGSALKEVAVPGAAVNKEATAKKDAILEVAAGEEPTMSEVAPEVTLKPKPDEASREVEVTEATLEDRTD